MSKSANPGELRTRVYFMLPERVIDDEGCWSDTLVDVFGQDSEGNNIPCMCKWVNAHGTEVFQGMQLQIREPATITTRYSSLLTDPRLVIYKENDTKPYEAISYDDVEERHRWLEIKVQRKSGAR